MSLNGLPNTIEVPKEDWKFGYVSSGRSKDRVIAKFIIPNGLFGIDIGVKQYDKEEGTETSKYYCVGCFRRNQIKNYGQFFDGKFYAPSFHHGDCPTISAEYIGCVQKRFEKKYQKWCKVLASFSTIYTFPKPRQQEFSLPIPLIRYMIVNPQTHGIYDKLVKSCKWFYGRNKLILSEKKKIKTEMDDDVTEIISLGLDWNIEKLPLPLIQRVRITENGDEIETDEDDEWDFDF